MTHKPDDIADGFVMLDLGPAAPRPAKVGVRAVPTLAQVRTMAALDGRLPMSYVLDRERNFVPPEFESMGYADQLGRCGLAF